MKTEYEIERILTRPLPAEAIKEKDSKKLNRLVPIYITERLNEAYGRGQWSQTVENLGADMWVMQVAEYENGKPKKDDKGNAVFKDKEMYTAKVKVCITLPNGTSLECIASSDNDDEGDASKGAITDCQTKIASWLGIGAHIWKNQTLEQAWEEWNNADTMARVNKSRAYITANAHLSSDCAGYMAKLNNESADLVTLAKELHKELQNATK